MAAEARRIFCTSSSAPGRRHGRDLGDVPDDRAPGVEVRGPDEEDAPLLVLRRDGVEHLLRDGFLEEIPEGRRVGHRVAVEDGEDPSLRGDVLHGDGGVHRLQLLVVRRSEERERRDERPRADARDELERRPRPGLRPAVEQARSERAVVAAAGDGEVGGRRQRPGVALGGQVGSLASPGLDEVLLEHVEPRGVAGKVPDPVREAGHGRRRSAGPRARPCRAWPSRSRCASNAAKISPAARIDLVMVIGRNTSRVFDHTRAPCRTRGAVALPRDRLPI